MIFLSMLRPAARTMGWRNGLITALAGFLVAAVPVLFSVDLQPDDLATILRIVAVLGALSVGSLLYDRASTISAVMPTSRLARHLARVLWIGVAAVPWWIMVLLLVRSSASTEIQESLPLTGLTAEAVAVFGAALAATAGAQRLVAEEHIGLAGALALLLLAAGVVLLPDDMALILSPTDPRFGDARIWWNLLAAVSAMAFLSLARERAPQPVVRRWAHESEG